MYCREYIWGLSLLSLYFYLGCLVVMTVNLFIWMLNTRLIPKMWICHSTQLLHINMKTFICMEAIITRLYLLQRRGTFEHFSFRMKHINGLLLACFESSSMVKLISQCLFSCYVKSSTWSAVICEGQPVPVLE